MISQQGIAAAQNLQESLAKLLPAPRPSLELSHPASQNMLTWGDEPCEADKLLADLYDISPAICDDVERQWRGGSMRRLLELIDEYKAELAAEREADGRRVFCAEIQNDDWGGF